MQQGKKVKVTRRPEPKPMEPIKVPKPAEVETAEPVTVRG